MFYGKHKVDGSYGFFQSADKCANGVEISEETWKSLMNAQQNGQQIVPDENGAPVLQDIPDNRTYAEKRAAEYPALGDMIDAFCKAKAGDETELMALMAERDAIKAKYPKPEAAVEQVSDQVTAQVSEQVTEGADV